MLLVVLVLAVLLLVFPGASLFRHTPTYSFTASFKPEKSLAGPSLFYHPIVETMNNEAAKQVKNIMLIDDNEIDLFIASKTIINSGFKGKIITHTCGPAALKELLEKATSLDGIPELIFLDIQMPDMNGFEFLEEFKRLDAAIRNKIRIVMLTSSADCNDLKRAIEEPAVQKFMNKPLTSVQVIETLVQIQGHE